MKVQCMTRGVSSAVCTRQPPTASMFASLCLPVWSPVRSCTWCSRRVKGRSHGAEEQTSRHTLKRPCNQSATTALLHAQRLRGISRWFTPSACGPGSPELSKYDSVMACKLFTFTFIADNNALYSCHITTSTPALQSQQAAVRSLLPPPAVRFRVCPGAAPRACSCLAHVRPCAQGRRGRCPPGPGVPVCTRAVVRCCVYHTHRA